MSDSTIADVVTFLHEFAPLELAEDWDNVGLLLGDDAQPVQRIHTCLTLTEDVAGEAVDAGAELIVTHHPVLFRPVQRLVSTSSEGRTLMKLIAAGVAVYSPHTAFDSAQLGINQWLANHLGLIDVHPLRPVVPTDESTSRHDDDSANVGGGRCGMLPKMMTFNEFNQLVKERLGVAHLQFVGDPERIVNRVAVACGAAAEFLKDADEHECDVLLTGEARFHNCLDARQRGVAMVLPGHYATERPAVEALADIIHKQFPDLVVTPSAIESDPIQWDVSSDSSFRNRSSVNS